MFASERLLPLRRRYLQKNTCLLSGISAWPKLWDAYSLPIFIGSLNCLALMFGRASTGLDPVLHRLRPTQWDLFLDSPVKFLARLLYNLAERRQPPEQINTGINVVCISDTYNFEPNIPYADLLIHTGVSSRPDLQSVLSWLNGLPHPNKVMIPGASYALSQPADRARLDWTGITLLDDSSTTIKFSGGRELNVFGNSGMSHPRRPGIWGFSDPYHWTDRVPTDTDILVSYMPPGKRFQSIGDNDDNLLAEMWRTKPQLHVSGYMWDDYGKEYIVYDSFGMLFERICGGPQGAMACIMLMEMLLRFVGFVLWRPRSGNGAILVRAAAVGQSKHREKRKPIVVCL